MADAADPSLNFSYAGPTDPWLKRFVIRAVERMTGQPYLKSVYEDYRANPLPSERFWEAAVRRLDLTIVCNEDALERLPKTGPLVVVANHPFGVLDGVVICDLIARVRPDFLVLTNELLTRAKELKPWLLPIDFAETEEALATNLKSRAAAKHHLMNGGCLVVFPAGGVSTTPTLWHRHATDAEWKKFTARLITQAKAAVVPVFFAGQNSRLFQVASHVSMTLRLSLLFKEIHDRIGSEVHVRIGEVVPLEQISALSDRQAVMNHLRSLTYALGEGLSAPRGIRTKRRRRAA